MVGGQPPVNDRRVGGKHNTIKQEDSGLGGWMLRKFQGEPLKPDHVLAFCQASFHMTLSWVGFLTLAPGNKLWKILKEMRIPGHLTCLLRNLYAGQEAIARTEHGKIDWFQIEKGVRQVCILSPCLFNLCED